MDAFDASDGGILTHGAIRSERRPGWYGVDLPLLDSNVKVVAISGSRRAGYVEQVRNRPDVAIWEVTPDNRDSMFGEALAWVGQMARYST